MSESTESRPTSAPGVSVMNADEKRLHELGYAQELHRGMGWFSNFAVSFTIISILTGGITTYYLGMVAGGPRVIIWGWLFVGGMVMLVGAGMAEVCSSFPTAGGLYYWAAKLAPDGKAPVWSWFTGWFNLLGQVAVTASIDFSMATFCGFFLNLTTGFQGTAKSLFGIYTLVLIAHGILNSLGVNIIAKLNDISVWWHLTGVVVIVGALFILPDAHKHQSLSNVFTKYYDGLGWGFGGHAIWVVLVGLMMAQYTLTGYDASAHMTEETHDAATQWAARHHDVDLGVRCCRPRLDDRTHVRDPVRDRQRCLCGRCRRRHQRARRLVGRGDRSPCSRVPYSDLPRRAVLLRHGVGDCELADDLRLLSRRRSAWLAALAQGEQAHAHANELHLVRRGGRVHPRPAVAVPEQGLLGRVLRDRVRSGRRPLRLVRHSGVASPDARV